MRAKGNGIKVLFWKSHQTCLLKTPIFVHLFKLLAMQFSLVNML